MSKKITRQQFEAATDRLNRNQSEYVRIDNAYARGELTEAQARRKMDAMIESNNKAMAICATYKDQLANPTFAAASTLGAIQSKKKSKASRANGKHGGRPKGGK